MRHCLVCDADARRFLPHGRRPDARCPRCGSFERHRLLFHHLRGRDLGRVLHFAPATCFRPRLTPSSVTVDLRKPGVDAHVDAVALPFRDAAFDTAICSHVLEHVPDDRRALAELHRVLRPGGGAFLLVPINLETTDGDPAITDEAERRLRYGAPDHVRNYGWDFVDRVRATGFDVTNVEASHVFDAAERKRYAVTGERLFHAQRK